MAFFNVNGRTKNGEFLTKLEVWFVDPEFKINTNFLAVKHHTKNALVDIHNKNSDCVIPFSGGEDSYFVALCYKELVEEGGLPENSYQLINALFKYNHQYLNESHFDYIDSMRKHLRIEQIIFDIDDNFFGKMFKSATETGESGGGSLMQYVVFDSLPGTMVIPEGRPVVMRKPWICTDNTLSEKKYLCDIARTYEALPKRINLFSYSRDLYQSFITRNNLNFAYPNISKQEYDSMSNVEKYNYKNLRHRNKEEIYYACFPEMKNVFSDSIKISSAEMDPIAKHPLIRRMQNYIYNLYETQSVKLHPKERVFGLSEYYNYTWSDFKIKGNL